MENFSVGAAVPLQLPLGVSAFARFSLDVPADIKPEQQQQPQKQQQQQQQQGKEQQHLQHQEQYEEKQQQLPLLAKREVQHLQQLLQQQLQRQLQQLRLLQKSGLRTQLLLGVQAPHTVGGGGALRCLASLGKDKPRFTISASQGGSEVSATVSGSKLLGLAALKEVTLHKTKVAVETAYDMEKGETAVRVAGAGYTGASLGGLLPSLIGLDMRIKSPLVRSSRAAARARARARAEEETGDENGEGEKEAPKGDTALTKEEETLDVVSLGVSLAFGKRADFLVEPKYHPAERHVSLEVTRRHLNGGLVSLQVSPKSLGVRWVDAAADGGYWVFSGRMLLQPTAAKDQTSSDRVSFSLRREGLV